MQKPLLYAIVGGIIGAVVFIAGLHLVKEFAEMILRMDPVNVGIVGAFIGACAGVGGFFWLRSNQ